MPSPPQGPWYSGIQHVYAGLVKKSFNVLTEQSKLSQNRQFAVCVTMKALKETISFKKATLS